MGDTISSAMASVLDISAVVILLVDSMAADSTAVAATVVAAIGRLT
jgi:hypothetical protein